VLFRVFTRHREDAVLDFELEIVRPYSGQIRPQGHGVVTTDDIDRRHPGAPRGAAQLVEEAIEAPADIGDLRERIPAYQCSGHQLCTFLVVMARDRPPQRRLVLPPCRPLHGVNRATHTASCNHRGRPPDT
jgi:hypothetical protein